MKVKCPVCGKHGLLQKRGNNTRIQHYQGFVNGKRIYIYHKNVGSKLEVNSYNLRMFKEKKILKSKEHQPPKLGVVGSNPSPPATDKPRPFSG